MNLSLVDRFLCLDFALLSLFWIDYVAIFWFAFGYFDLMWAVLLVVDCV